MIRRPPRSTLDRSSAASDVYKRQVIDSAKARFEVENYEMYVKLQSDTAVRHLAGSYSYDHFSDEEGQEITCLLYTSPSPRDRTRSRMPSSACKKKSTPLFYCFSTLFFNTYLCLLRVIHFSTKQPRCYVLYFLRYFPVS